MSASYREGVLLDRFWQGVGAHEDRLELLKRYAGIRVDRPAGWTAARVRGESRSRHLPAQCFGCLTGDKRLYWHHVIQVQHGGSNAPHNLVAICHRCHQAVHPWLEDATTLELKHGPYALRDVMAAGFAVLEDALSGRKRA